MLSDMVRNSLPVECSQPRRSPPSANNSSRGTVDIIGIVAVLGKSALILLWSSFRRNSIRDKIAEREAKLAEQSQLQGFVADVDDVSDHLKGFFECVPASAFYVKLNR